MFTFFQVFFIFVVICSQTIFMENVSAPFMLPYALEFEHLKKNKRFNEYFRVGPFICLNPDAILKNIYKMFIKNYYLYCKSKSFILNQYFLAHYSR